jgi:hypothetical protein
MKRHGAEVAATAPFHFIEIREAWERSYASVLKMIYPLLLNANRSKGARVRPPNFCSGSVFV